MSYTIARPAPEDYIVLETVVLETMADSGVDHCHMLVITKEYGPLMVWQLNDEDWLVSPINPLA